MNSIFVLFKKSFCLFWHNKAGVTITFLVPIVLIYLFGHVFGLYKKRDPGPTGIPLAVVNLSHEPAATDLVEALKAEKVFHVITEAKNADGTLRPLNEADVRTGLHDNQYRFALLLPADMMSD